MFWLNLCQLSQATWHVLYPAGGLLMINNTVFSPYWVMPQPTLWGYADHYQFAYVQAAWRNTSWPHQEGVRIWQRRLPLILSPGPNPPSFHHPPSEMPPPHFSSTLLHCLVQILTFLLALIRGVASAGSTGFPTSTWVVTDVAHGNILGRCNSCCVDERTLGLHFESCTSGNLNLYWNVLKFLQMCMDMCT